MLVRFAAARPDGTYALALPVPAGAPSADRLAGLEEGAQQIVRQSAEVARFEGEAATVLELFVSEGAGVRRLLSERRMLAGAPVPEVTSRRLAG